MIVVSSFGRATLVTPTMCVMLIRQVTSTTTMRTTVTESPQIVR
nr:MAG TPA: hypothetical protein [Caudoviricetes sp.]